MSDLPASTANPPAAARFAVAVAVALLGCFLCVSAGGQEFDCVELNDGNTNVFVFPDACSATPKSLEWCDCVRSAFTRPVRGSRTGFRQAILWVSQQPGIGNHRVEVESGTLDLRAVAVGDVLGIAGTDELVPEVFPLVGGELFTVEAEVRVALVESGAVDFHVVITRASNAVQVAIGYDPTDAAHSFGHFLTGRLATSGPGLGFVAEYRYATENFQADPPRFPGLQVSEVAMPVFNIPFRIELFSETGSTIYTLGAESEAAVTTTLRGFSDGAVDAILPLGAADLCAGALPTSPCRVFEDILPIRSSAAENSPPVAVIQPIDPVGLTLLTEPLALQTFCGRARVLFRGRNSSDGDGGFQPLSFAWSVQGGPEGGARIPKHTRDFMDCEISFLRSGEYEVTLRVDDGGGPQSVHAASIGVSVRRDFDVNIPPLAVIATRPAPPVVALRDGAASVELDANGSQNGLEGEDDCRQVLSFRWRQVSTSAERDADILEPDAVSTSAVFSAAGTYLFELTVDDGAEEDSFDRTEVEVTVREGDAESFLRGDANDDASINLTDAIRTLNFLFLGNVAPPPCFDAADTDDNGVLNLTDPIQVLRFLFLGGVEPSPPGPRVCGADPAADSLPRCMSAACP